MFKVKLHPFYEMDGDIGGSPSVEGTVESVSTEIASEQETPTAEVLTETSESESSFAKRLREHSEKAIKTEREKWEKETGEKYKDYDTLKDTAEFFRERHGFNDLLSMKEEIEMQKLQAKADENNISPEMQKRLEVLEAKSAKMDEMEQLQQQSQKQQEYFSKVDDFVKDKGVTSEDFNKFMVENGVILNTEALEKSFAIALKAMKAEEYEKKANEKESETISRYLSSKSAPRVDGSTGAASAQSVDTTKMSWKDLERHAAARLDASKTPS